MWFCEWCATSCATTTLTSPSEKRPSSSVFQSTMRRVGPKPAAYAFGASVRSETSSIAMGIGSVPCASANRRASASTRSFAGSFETRYGVMKAKRVASPTNAGAAPIHQRCGKRPAIAMTMTSARQMNRNSAPSTSQLSNSAST